MAHPDEKNISITGNTDGVELDIDPSARIVSLRIVVAGKGNKISIGANSSIQAYIYVAEGAVVTIGSHVKMNGQLSLHAHEGMAVSIGEGCLFSNNVIIRPSDVHKIMDLTTGKRINVPKPISIGANVWVGEHTSIMKGSVIPAGCVVGAKSLVTKVFDEPNCVIAGNPAKVVRRHISWQH